MQVHLAERLTASQKAPLPGGWGAPAGGTLVPDPFFIVFGALGQPCRGIAPASPAARTMAGLATGLNGSSTSSASRR
jgi:hypothetical protein